MSDEQAQTYAELSQHLLSLELQLMDPDFRRDRRKVSSLLSSDFREFGSSGREWDCQGTLHLLEAESGWTAPVVEDFTMKLIALGAALVTYRAIRPTQRTLRSSLWIREGGDWRILFHQGTKYSET